MPPPLDPVFVLPVIVEFVTVSEPENARTPAFGLLRTSNVSRVVVPPVRTAPCPAACNVRLLMLAVVVGMSKIQHAGQPFTVRLPVPGPLMVRVSVMLGREVARLIVPVTPPPNVITSAPAV